MTIENAVVDVSMDDAVASVGDFIGRQIEARCTGDFDVRMRLVVELKKALDELTALSKRISSEIESMGSVLVEEMAERGYQNLRVDDRKVFIRSDFYCSKKSDKYGVTTGMVIAALRGAGLGDLVSEGYAAGTLKSQIKEMIDEGVDVPEVLQRVLNYGVVQRLSISK